MDWHKEKERKRAERENVRIQRHMASPVLRAEVFQLGEEHLQHIASLALAIEALEDILIAKKLLVPSELIDKMKVLAEKKAEEVQAMQLAVKEN